MQDGWIYLGEGKKFNVLTKCVKKNTLLFSLGIFQSLIKSMGGKWVGFYCDFSVDSFYCDIVMLCTDDLCRMDGYMLDVDVHH